MEFTRGDTYKFKFQRRDFNNEVIKTKATKLWFTVKKDYKTENILIQKQLSDGSITFDDDGYYHIEIKPEDTSKLKYKKYVCDIQVENQHGEVTTVYKDTVKLLNEVTFLDDNKEVVSPPITDEKIAEIENDLKDYIDDTVVSTIQGALNNGDITVPNSSSTKVGGIKTHFDTENNTLYMTNDGTSPVPSVSQS